MKSNSKIDAVGFTCVSESGASVGQPLDLSGKKYKSRESCGVWVFRDKTWKIFSSREQYDLLKAVYDHAKASGLPIPEFTFKMGLVTVSNSKGVPLRKGFALVSTHITSGRSFALKNGTSNFERAIDSTTNDKVLKKIWKALQVARDIGLQDPQGFIDPKNVDNPIMFIDIHTRSVAPVSLQDLQDYISERRSNLLARGR